MSILSSSAIEKWLNKSFPERLIVTPLFDRAEQIKGNAVDLRLGNEFIITRRTSFAALDPRDSAIKKRIDEYQERVRVGLRKAFVLHPNQLILAHSMEYVGLPSRLAAYVIGRSSWGRLGLVIATATYVSPGFKGCITLELINHGEAPLVLYPGARIAQLVLHLTKGKAEYGSRYFCPTSPEFSKIYADREIGFWAPSPTEEEENG